VQDMEFKENPMKGRRDPFDKEFRSESKFPFISADLTNMRYRTEETLFCK
jgi:hypothetical protein